MEKEIMSIILNKLYNNKVTELYNKKDSTYKFPIKISVNKLPFNIIYDFSVEFFDDYRSVLVLNGFLYAIYAKDKKLIEYFITNINNIDKTLDNDLMFKLKIIEYGIKNIFNKNYNKKYNDQKIINKYSHIINKINNNYQTVTTITTLYRNMLLDFIFANAQDDLIILENIFFSNKEDENIISFSKGLIDKENLISFKNILLRIILGDVFLYIENTKEDDDYDYDMEYEDDEIEEDLEIQEETDSRILEHINNCIKSNKWTLPKGLGDRVQTFEIFLNYNRYEDLDRKIYMENIREDKEKTLSLKKINPYYIFDLMD